MTYSKYDNEDNLMSEAEIGNERMTSKIISR
jgi:hypothetical protein